MSELNQSTLKIATFASLFSDNWQTDVSKVAIKFDLDNQD